MTRILVVEDYPSLQAVYKTVLEAEGFEVWVAKDGEEALKVAEAHEPDLILLDLLLPKEGGLEFLRDYDTKKHFHVRVVVFSNMASPELYDEARALGATEYLIKANYTPKEVVGAVKAALQANPKPKS
jgi:CheY-like chemotaxis protein